MDVLDLKERWHAIVICKVLLWLILAGFSRFISRYQFRVLVLALLQYEISNRTLVFEGSFSTLLFIYDLMFAIWCHSDNALSMNYFCNSPLILPGLSFFYIRQRKAWWRTFTLLMLVCIISVVNRMFLWMFTHEKVQLYYYTNNQIIRWICD